MSDKAKTVLLKVVVIGVVAFATEFLWKRYAYPSLSFKTMAVCVLMSVVAGAIMEARDAFAPKK